jgi:membrane fusion protein (multidrug efflux system)
MAVDISVDQREIPRFTNLKEHPAPEKDSIFTLLLPDNSVYSKTGFISLTDRAVDPQTGTIKTRLVFPNNGQLKAGMSTNIRVKNNHTGEFLLAPYKSVLEQMGEYFVFVLGDSSKVLQRKIILGIRINDKVIVKDGLKPGDKVVAEGIQKLKDGTVVNAAAPKTTKP